MEILSAIIIVLLGLAVGSFLNVCIDRLPAGKSLVYPPSKCDSCQKRISPRDLIPVFSYLWLRGRCRYCRAKIPLRTLLVEIISGVLFLLAYGRFGWSAGFAVTVFYCCVFLVIMFIDLEHQLILNKVTYPAAVVALVILAVDSFWPGLGLLHDIFSLSVKGQDFLFLSPQPSILSGLIGAGIGLAFFLIVFLIYPRGMGMGDIKLAGLIGLATGFPLGLVALFIGIFIGGLAAVALLLTGRKGRKDVIPYGVFLGIGPIVTLLCGANLLYWYKSLY